MYHTLSLSILLSHLIFRYFKCYKFNFFFSLFFFIVSTWFVGPFNLVRQSDAVKHRYSILERVPVSGTNTRMVYLGYAPMTYLFYFYFCCNGYPCGTSVVHESKKMQFFSFVFIRFYLFIRRFMFFICVII
jgi:hypothetical protein